MIRPLVVIGAALALLSACAEPPPPAPAHAPPAPPRHRPPPVEHARDECGAREHQDLVGKPRSKIPVPVLPDLQRVACTTCPVTMEYIPKRLNFFYDAETGIIKEVRCG
jgi:hypothetical protein